jgi:hypothetical protein
VKIVTLAMDLIIFIVSLVKIQVLRRFVNLSSFV